MSEFEAEVRNGIRALTSQVTAMGNSLTKTKNDGKKMGDEVSAAFKKAKDAVAEAKKKQDEFNKSILQTGQALQKMGGPLGGIIGQLTGGAGLPSGLARAAAGAALLGIAWKAFSAVSEMNLDRTKKLIEAQRELRDVSTGAAKSIKSQALGAVSSQGGDLRTLAFRGGQPAINIANELSESGATSPGDARSAVSAAYGINFGMDVARTTRTREGLIEVGKQVAQSGEGSATDAVNKIIADPILLNKLNKEGGAQDVTRRMIVRNRGMLETDQNLARAQTDLDMRGKTKIEKGVTAVYGMQGQIATAEQGGITNGKAEVAAREELSAAKDPHSAAMVELFQKQMQADADLAKMATAQGKIMGFMADIFKPEGSFETQLKRIANARSQATFSPDK